MGLRNIAIDSKLHSELKSFCAIKGVSLKKEVERLIREAISKEVEVKEEPKEEVKEPKQEASIKTDEKEVW
jgi:hypothetical protein